VTAHRLLHRGQIGDVEPHRPEPALPVAGQERRQGVGSEIGKGNLADRGLLQQIVGAGAALEARAENQLTGALRQLFAVAENYPDLKASRNFLELQNEITDTEDKIQAARRFYNMTVRDLNIKVETFPSRVIASMRGIGKRQFFELDEPADRAVPEVSFGAPSAPGA